MAVVAALWATEDGTDKCIYHYSAWAGLFFAGAAFIGEIYVDDVEPHLKVGPYLRKKWQCLRGKSATDSATT